MAMTTIDKMKDIFNGPKTLLYSKAITDLSKATVDITQIGRASCRERVSIDV